MITSLQYGRDKKLSLEIPKEALVANLGSAQGSPLEDPIAAVRAALANPIDFPPLNQTVLVEDRVAIVLESGLACAPELVAGVVGALTDIGTPPELISIVRASGDKGISNKQLLSFIGVGVSDRLNLIEHDQDNRETLSFLGASKEEQPFLVNRVLCDADVVIPIASQQDHDRSRCLGVHHSWFPTFADHETQARFHKSLSSMQERKRIKRKEECVEAAWMLGVQMIVLLVPAGDDLAMHILAGTPNAVWKRGTELANAVWRVNVGRRASLVVAAIGGGPEQQTWQNVTRTIDTALEALEVDGTIAVCSQLKTKPGPAMRRLAGSLDYEAANLAIRQKPTADSLDATRLNRALQRARVYLLSELDEHDVENLGVAYVADSREIAKLSTQHDSFLLLDNAQHVSISLNETSSR